MQVSKEMTIASRTFGHLRVLKQLKYFWNLHKKTAEIDNLATQIDQALAKSAQLKSEVATLQNELAKLAAS